MALQTDYYVSRFEVTKKNCYWKIAVDNGINGGKLELSCRILCYKDQATADTNSGEWDSVNFSFSPDLKSDDNFLTQAYIYAKTLLQFAAATDI